MPGPYRPTDQQLGETPSIIPDIPISAVLLVLYIIGGALHMRTFLANKKKGHFFLLSAMTFGFCNSRIVTFILRIAFTTHVTNIRLAIASGVFVYAGTVLLFAINLVFTQRIIRAQHPRLGWSKPFSMLFPAIYGWIVFSLVILIIAVIQSFYTLSTNTLRIDRDIQLYGRTAYAVIAFLPIPFVLLSTAIKSSSRLDHFGHGSMTSKILIVLASATIMALGAAYRAGVNILPPTPLSAPDPWYFNKACFYCFNFVIELLVVYGWFFARIDQRFHVPNKSNGKYDYPAYLESRNQSEKAENQGSDSEDDVNGAKIREPGKFDV